MDLNGPNGTAHFRGTHQQHDEIRLVDYARFCEHLSPRKILLLELFRTIFRRLNQRYTPVKEEETATATTTTATTTTTTRNPAPEFERIEISDGQHLHVAHPKHPKTYSYSVFSDGKIKISEGRRSPSPPAR